ncbi:MAG TPA: substrate-binding domain-containing protein [Paludibacter sp.]|nr:substrate-binding domain-containing protein [Paludibacter sp.]
MEELNNKIRIKDIAKLAGVSEGTVDRVIHQRGDVSAKSLEAVNKVLEEINYTPNLIARSLASKKQYRFVCLYPKHNETDYWQSVDDGFNLAANEFIHYNVQIEKLYFNQFDAQSFIDISNNALKKKPDAVFIAPIFRKECLLFVDELKNRNIPFSFIDSMIEDTDFVTYYGQHSFQSGYIAAKLLLNSFVDNEKVLVIRTQRKGAVSNQTLNRNNGFLRYIQDKKLVDKLELINVEFKGDDESSNLEVLRNVFSTHTNIKAAITFNSKVHQLAMHLENLNRMDVDLIGYDLLEQNVAYLKKNMITYLIAQRPDKQAYFTVRDMCKKLIFKQEISKINYVPIDILMKENIEYYIKFRE